MVHCCYFVLLQISRPGATRESAVHHRKLDARVHVHEILRTVSRLRRKQRKTSQHILDARYVFQIDVLWRSFFRRVRARDVEHIGVAAHIAEALVVVRVGCCFNLRDLVGRTTARGAAASRHARFGIADFPDKMRGCIAVRSHCCFCCCTCWQRGVAWRRCSRGRRPIAEDLCCTAAWCCRIAGRRQSTRDRARRIGGMQCRCSLRSSSTRDRTGNPRRSQPTIATLANHCRTGALLFLTLAFQSCECSCWQHALEVRPDTDMCVRVNFYFDEDYFAATCQIRCLCF